MMETVTCHLVIMCQDHHSLTVSSSGCLLNISLRNFREGVTVGDDLGDRPPPLPQPPAAGQPAHAAGYDFSGIIQS